MRISTIAFVVAAGALCAVAPRSFADDPKAADDARASGVIVFGDGVARFNVAHDRALGTLTFRTTEPAVRITDAPVVVLTTDAGPKEVTLVPAAGQTGVWVLRDDSLRGEKYDGTIRVNVSGKVYTSPLVVAGPVPVVARHGGTILAFPECTAHVEIVRDNATGMLTIYSAEDVQVLEPPVVTTTEVRGPTTMNAVQVSPGVWRVTNESFKQRVFSGRIKIMVNGKPCETSLSFAPHGGRLVTVTGGPSFEVVQQAKTNGYTFYAVDETYEGKPYTIENPTVVVNTAEGPRTVVLEPVPGEPRAWQMIGLGAGVSDPGDAHLRFTLFGKSLETSVGLSGIGIGVR